MKNLHGHLGSYEKLLDKLDKLNQQNKQIKVFYENLKEDNEINAFYDSDTTSVSNSELLTTLQIQVKAMSKLEGKNFAHLVRLLKKMPADTDNFKDMMLFAKELVTTLTSLINQLDPAKKFGTPTRAAFTAAIFREKLEIMMIHASGPLSHAETL